MRYSTKESCHGLKKGKEVCELFGVNLESVLANDVVGVNVHLDCDLLNDPKPI